jgi:hypothetical protein
MSVVIGFADETGATAETALRGDVDVVHEIRARLLGMQQHLVNADATTHFFDPLGDGVLFIARRPVLIVKAALELQRGWNEHRKGLPMRIALSYGEPVWLGGPLEGYGGREIAGTIVNRVCRIANYHCPDGGLVITPAMHEALDGIPSIRDQFEERKVFIKDFDGEQTIWVAAGLGRPRAEPDRHGERPMEEASFTFHDKSGRLRSPRASTVVLLVALMALLSVGLWAWVSLARAQNGSHAVPEAPRVIERLEDLLSKHVQSDAVMKRAIVAMCHGIHRANPDVLALCGPLPSLLEVEP